MANLAIVGSHSTNGVAAIHSELLRTTTVKDLAEMFPERFNNKTNGVTPRRWLLLPTRRCRSAITEAIGEGWITDLSRTAQAEAACRRQRFRDSFPKAKREAKSQFADWLKATSGRLSTRTRSSTARSSGSTNTSDNCSTRCGSSSCTTGCARIRTSRCTPRTFFFAGKAAPAYHLAKLIIKFINNLAGTIDGDPAVRGRLKVVFFPSTAFRWPRG